MKNLIVYSSKYGGTGKIAEVLNRDLIEGGEIINLDTKEKIALEDYENVFIGTSIYIGKARKNVIRFCEQHLNDLLEKTTGIFISCWDESQLDEYIEESFPEKLVDQAKIVYAGLIANPAQMSLLDRLIVKFVTKMEQPVSDIKYQNLKELAEIVQ